MKKQRILTSILLSLLILALLGTPLAIANDGSPAWMARAVVLADAHTGEILYARNEHDRIDPASTTKIMTALLAIEALERGEVSISDQVTTSETALFDMIPTGASLELQVGEIISFEALLYAVMLRSANDASNVVAEHVSGSVDSFLHLMNTRARELGAYNTNFTNTHGLTAYNHYSTAYDLFLITQYAISHPRFVELYALQERPHAASSMADGSEGRYAGIFVSTNRLTDPESDYYFPGAHGVKTGFTSAAGLCLISTATRGDVSFLAVVMGVPVDVAEVEHTGETLVAESVNHFTQTAHLYEWAFYTFAYREVLSADTVLAIVPVEFGEEADSIDLITAEPIISLAREGTNLDHFEREVTLFHQEAGTTLSAPITRGDVLGEVTFTYGDRTFGPIALIAADSITLSRVEVIQHEVEETLQSGWVQFAVIAFIALFLLFVIGGIIRGVRKRKRKRARMGRR